MQEFRTGATRQNMETTHVKEESKRLRSQLGELRDKLADLDAKVAATTTCPSDLQLYCFSVKQILK